MAEHMKKEIERTKKQLLEFCAKVEENLWLAVKSLTQRDGSLADAVIDSDAQIDEMEVELEENYLKILALYQPVAADLRFIITALKITTDLERIADLAVNIAERSRYLISQPEIDVYFDFQTMAQRTQKMLRKSLDALVNSDVVAANQVCQADDEIDAMNRQMYELVKQSVRRNPEWIDILSHMLSTSRHLERIADHTTNIAEDVIYMVKGQIVRHRVEEYTG